MKLILLNLVLAIISSFVAAYLVLARRYRRSRIIATLVIGASIWAYGYALEMFFIDIHAKLFWVNIQFIGMALTNTLPIFVAHFFEKEELITRRNLLTLSVIPTAFIGLVVTNGYHGLIIKEAFLNYLEPNYPLIINYGAGTYAFLVYSYTLLIASCLYAAGNAKDYSEGNWKKIWVFIGMFSLPIVSSIYHIFIAKEVTIDYTATIFNVLAIGFSLFVPTDMRVGNIFPLEYASILGEMKDIVILTNFKGYIMYLNPAGKTTFNKLLGVDEDNIAGKNIEVFLNTQGVKYNEDINEVSYKDTIYHLSPFTLQNWRGKDTSYGYIMRDISERVTLEKKLQSLHVYASRIANSGSYEDIANITKKALQNSLGYKEGCLVILKDRHLDFHLHWGIGDKILTRVMSNETTFDNLLKMKESQIVPDLNDFLRNIQYDGDLPRSKALVMAPVLVGGKLNGIIALFNHIENQFTNNDQMLLEIFGEHVTSAIQRLKNQETFHKMQEDEFKKILAGAGRVSSMVRHDLRGPLQTVKNATYIVKKNPEKIMKMAPIINKSVDYMVKILDDLQYQDQPGSYVKMRLNLNTVIHQTLVHQMIPDNIRIVTNLYSDTVEHMLDKVKIQRMLDNLIRNAIDAMEGNGTLYISTEKCTYGTELVVRDTGKGIANMDKLFTPFHTTKINGMGLGLISVKQTVEAHDGMIDVLSVPGEGTTFRIGFPDVPNHMGSKATKLKSMITR